MSEDYMVLRRITDGDMKPLLYTFNGCKSW